MYIPELSLSLKTLQAQQIRLGIQGFPGTGKTWGAVTFPNPIVIDLDRGLGAHIGENILIVPLYDVDFCKKINPNHKGKESLINTLLLWLEKHGSKLESDQTLIVDGSTSIQNAYHTFYAANKVYTKDGKVDDYAQWRLKVDFFSNICECFKVLKCSVIYIAHESEQKNNNGEYTGKIRPLLTGQFVDQLASHFTDWFRAKTINKYDPTKLTEKEFKLWGMNKDELIKMQSTFPRDTIYYWQTCSDTQFDGKASSLVNYPDYLVSNYESFKKYMKFKSTINETPTINTNI